LISKPGTMKTNKIFLFGFLISFFILLDKRVFAGTGGPNDGQVMLLVILAVLSAILGILYFFPRLVHLIRDLWKKYHHC
jgi:hypothetical protein